MSEKSRSSVQSYNKYLRESSSEGSILTMDLQSQQEQLSALGAILMYAHRTSSGKGRKICAMTIRLQFEDSERSHT